MPSEPQSAADVAQPTQQAPDPVEQMIGRARGAAELLRSTGQPVSTRTAELIEAFAAQWAMGWIPAQPTAADNAIANLILEVHEWQARRAARPVTPPPAPAPAPVRTKRAAADAPTRSRLAASRPAARRPMFKPSDAGSEVTGGRNA